MEIRVTQRYGAAPERVFDAWLDPAIAGKWLFATATRPMSGVAIDARAGGSFRFEGRLHREDVVRTGRYVEIVRPRRLVFTLSGEKRPDRASRVNVDIVPLAAGCEVVVLHERVPLDCAHRTENRWTGMLYGLGETLGDRSRQLPAARRQSRITGRNISDG
jgi:uncharacterized protein YndB with AHSA1/START domain